MADQKVSDMTALASFDGTELFYVVDDPAGTPLDRKVAAADLKTYVNNGAAGASVLASPNTAAAQTGIGSTFTAITALSPAAVTVPAAGVVIRAVVTATQQTGDGIVKLRIYDVTAGAAVGQEMSSNCVAGKNCQAVVEATHAPGAGSRTYRVEMATTTNTVTFQSGQMIIEGRAA